MNLKKQNILFLTRTMKMGGTENVILQLCEIFKPLVNKIVVCSSGGVNVEKLSVMEIKHYTISDIADKKPKMMFHTYKKIDNIIKKEKITVIHSHHRMAAMYANLAAPKNVIKIANAHNTFYDKKVFTKIAYKGTKIIAVGDMVKKNLTGYFKILDAQVTVIHNTVKPFESQGEETGILKSLKESGFTLIGNVGRLSEQKGMRYFIEAACMVYKEHPNTKFIIVGDGEDKKVLMELVEEKKLKDTVIFLGYRSDVQNVMSQMDFVVLSSLWEGFPLTPIEAFSVGKTIVATNVDGTWEIVQDNINGYLVKPRDVKELAEKMEYMIQNPLKMKELEKNAKERYESEFCFEKLKKGYIKYYEEL